MAGSLLLLSNLLRRVSMATLLPGRLVPVSSTGNETVLPLPWQHQHHHHPQQQQQHHRGRRRRLHSLTCALMPSWLMRQRCYYFGATPSYCPRMTTALARSTQPYPDTIPLSLFLSVSPCLYLLPMPFRLSLHLPVSRSLSLSPVAFHLVKLSFLSRQVNLLQLLQNNLRSILYPFPVSLSVHLSASRPPSLSLSFPLSPTPCAFVLLFPLSFYFLSPSHP